jgi:glyoxylase-like metal-dependent hydrolase (beta-lactamase superfamily II)
MNSKRRILGTLAPLVLAACGGNAARTNSEAEAGGPAVDSGADILAADSATDASALAVQTYSSSATGMVDIQVNSHLVLGATEAVLVDSQLLMADARAVADMVTRSGRKLTTVFLTHAHPDHYLGLAVIHAAFPSAAIVATPGVLADFSANAAATLALLQSAGLTSVIASSLVTPSSLAGNTIALDGKALEVIELPNAGETAHAAALALPGGALISGDLLMNHVHLYLGECHSAGWQQNLDAVKAMGFTTFYPGHGKAPVDASVFSDDTSYIAGAIPILRATRGPTRRRMTLATHAWVQPSERSRRPSPSSRASSCWGFRRARSSTRTSAPESGAPIAPGKSDRIHEGHTEDNHNGPQDERATSRRW